mmetsp:Transcript_150816/g.383477  ORF Transcript_150816/g.383477 Transcript_150816/m.383477 type:complete len:101 (-) Transcript_150816:146-448(-)
MPVAIGMYVFSAVQLPPRLQVWRAKAEMRVLLVVHVGAASMEPFTILMQQAPLQFHYAEDCKALGNLCLPLNDCTSPYFCLAKLHLMASPCTSALIIVST